jgi:hypothetical protein
MSDADLEPFELTGRETAPLVAAPESALRKQLRILRARNDSAMSEIETATLRGHIKFLKAAIASAKTGLRPAIGDTRKGAPTELPMTKTETHRWSNPPPMTTQAQADFDAGAAMESAGA